MLTRVDYAACYWGVVDCTGIGCDCGMLADTASRSVLNVPNVLAALMGRAGTASLFIAYSWHSVPNVLAALVGYAGTATLFIVGLW